MNTKIWIRKEDVRNEMARLDWIKIMHHAIENRSSSWYPIGFKPIKYISLVDGKDITSNKYSPSEWRNASDTIFSSVICAMEDAGILEPFFKEAKRFLKEFKKVKRENML